MIEEADDFEDRNEADRVRAEDEDEQAEEERRPDPEPLVADIRPRNAVADELDDDLERVRRAARHLPGASQVPAHERRDDQEDQARHDPEHQDVLADRHVDAEDRRQMDQRVIGRAVGDVPDDRLAGVEALAGGW